LADTLVGGPTLPGGLAPAVDGPWRVVGQ
jgi:hypothetical protein